jgi:hypothetical protein
MANSAAHGAASPMGSLASTHAPTQAHRVGPRFRAQWPSVGRFRPRFRAQRPSVGRFRPRFRAQRPTHNRFWSSHGSSPRNRSAPRPRRGAEALIARSPRAAHLKESTPRAAALWFESWRLLFGRGHHGKTEALQGVPVAVYREGPGRGRPADNRVGRRLPPRGGPLPIGEGTRDHGFDGGRVRIGGNGPPPAGRAASAPVSARR